MWFWGRKSGRKTNKKIKKEPLDAIWQACCIYVRAWWGQKGEMLKKYWFWNDLLKGQWGHEDASRTKNGATRSVFDVEATKKGQSKEK